MLTVQFSAFRCRSLLYTVIIIGMVDIRFLKNILYAGPHI